MGFEYDSKNDHAGRIEMEKLSITVPLLTLAGVASIVWVIVGGSSDAIANILK